MDPWTGLQASVRVASVLRQTEELLHGGLIAAALEEFGTVMVSAARDSLREAQASPQPRRRVEDAAAAMQVAYASYDRALSRGAPTRVRVEAARFSRRVFGRYRKSLGQAAGAAAAVATLRGVLGEPPQTLRRWLDRAARPVALERRAAHVTATQGSAIDSTLRWSGSGDAAVREHLLDYFMLERRLLPSRWVRPLPDAWTVTAHGEVTTKPIQELRGQRPLSLPLEGLTPRVAEFYAARPELHWSLGDPKLLHAQDRAGPHDIILMIHPDRVVPVFDDAA